MPRITRILLSCSILVWILFVPGGANAAGNRQRVLIRASKPYDALVARIEALGGRVTHQYKYVDAIAAEIPPDTLQAIRSLLPANAISKDELIDGPKPVDTLRTKAGLASSGAEDRITYDSVAGIDGPEVQQIATQHPDGYLVNNGISNAAALQAAGITGQGVIVGVIDSGIRPGFPHIELDGSVIGCEDFVGDGLGCSNSANNGHGTFVAGMISANVVFTFSPSSVFRNAVLAYCPGCFLNPPANTQIPMIGSAPLSSIYALRVFGPSGSSATSTILAAVERAIQLKQKFDAGQSGGVDIQVVNMSLGGATVFAGRDLFDTEVDTMLANGIVFTVSAGNAGPSSLTIGSPGSSFNSITVGAASLAHNERILRDLQFGPGAGALFRPFSGTQTAFFSSRGPNADGRPDPDLVANGFANFGQGFGSSPAVISVASGTSFSSPTVAGVAALLRQAFPDATARQIRNSILLTANDKVVTDGSEDLDQGEGYVDALAAYKLLASGEAPDTAEKPRRPSFSVAANVRRNTDLEIRSGVVQEHIDPLLPGERHDILYQVPDNTQQVVVTIANFDPELPAAQQNALFGDDILFAMHSSKTSAIGQGDYQTFTNTTGGTFILNDPDPGLVRITFSGDWTNAGKVAADVWIASTREPLERISKFGFLTPGQTLVFPVSIPAGVSQANFALDWLRNWSFYPTSDIDMYLVDPNQVVDTDGATLNSPEEATVRNPVAGTWFIVLDGFEIHAKFEPFTLSVNLDGQTVKIK